MLCAFPTLILHFTLIKDQGKIAPYITNFFLAAKMGIETEKENTNLMDRKFEVAIVVKINDGICKPFYGNLVNFDVYNDKFKSDACIEPFEIPQEIIKDLFWLICHRFKHDSDGVYTADIHVIDDNKMVGGAKIQLFIEDNRVLGVNKDFCYPRRKGKVAADE